VKKTFRGEQNNPALVRKEYYESTTLNQQILKWLKINQNEN
jgi:hypothetical protein